MEVTAQIGVGGMGEVYQATDTTLNRQVAIKVLPESLASDAERVARFEREAKTLASLNHPNIARIYGFEKSSGVHRNCGGWCRRTVTRQLGPLRLAGRSTTDMG